MACPAQGPACPERAHHHPSAAMPRPPEAEPTGTPTWLRDLAGAWIFYSVLPAWPWPQPRFQRIARFAPWVGAVLGALQGLLWWSLEGRVPPLAQVALEIGRAHV